MNILVTGGAGYIGSHTIIELLAAGHTVSVVDNLINSSSESLKRVEEISGKKVPLYTFDLQDTTRLVELLSRDPFDAVVHFAGLKAVGESVENSLLYYRTNLDASISLLEAMKSTGVKKLVFSSSATVYGSAPIPYNENSPTGNEITSPYGQTKHMIEQIVRDRAREDKESQFTILRYFNPVGAHQSGLIGEDPKGTPNNLMPFIAQVATGKRDQLSVFGADYPTPDGTCVRDYIHVVDLAKGHLAALTKSQPGVSTYNLGSGKGTSVLELIRAFENACGHAINFKIEARRSGDLPEFYADTTKASSILGWRTQMTIEQMCADTWNWQTNNPNGYL